MTIPRINCPNCRALIGLLGATPGTTERFRCCRCGHSWTVAQPEASEAQEPPPEMPDEAWPEDPMELFGDAAGEIADQMGMMGAGPRFKWKGGWRGDPNHCPLCGPESSCLSQRRGPIILAYQPTIPPEPTDDITELKSRLELATQLLAAKVTQVNELEHSNEVLRGMVKDRTHFNDSLIVDRGIDRRELERRDEDIVNLKEGLSIVERALRQVVVSSAIDAPRIAGAALRRLGSRTVLKCICRPGTMPCPVHP